MTVRLTDSERILTQPNSCKETIRKRVNIRLQLAQKLCCEFSSGINLIFRRTCNQYSDFESLRFSWID
jgi:hypothetical protein